MGQERLKVSCAECHCKVGIPVSSLGDVTGAEVMDALRSERGKDYGDPIVNHASIGAIWGGILVQAVSSGRWIHGAALPPELVTLMMVGVKVSREAYRHKQDNIDDAQVYLKFTEEMSL